MAKELTRKSKIGNMVTWETISGKRFEGELIEWDSNIAIIRVEGKFVDHTGTLRAVEC